MFWGILVKEAYISWCFKVHGPNAFGAPTLALVAEVQWREGGTHKDIVPRLKGSKTERIYRQKNMPTKKKEKGKPVRTIDSTGLVLQQSSPPQALGRM